MAIFSKSVFQSMLDRLEDEGSATQGEDAPVLAVRGLSAGFVANVGPSTGPGIAIDDAYRAFGYEVPIVELSMPDHLARLSVQEITEDLAIMEGDTLRDLAARRRAFAQLNHPDSVHPDHRFNATIRMKIANQLIDAAIKALG